MLIFFTELRHKWMNSPLFEVVYLSIIDDRETVGADSQRTNVGNIKTSQLCQSPKCTMNMLTFFAALCHEWANPSSLKLSVSTIIDDWEIVGVDSRRTNIRVMKN